jgi:hypothetical protein
MSGNPMGLHSLLQGLLYFYLYHNVLEFYSEDLLINYPTPKFLDHHLSSVHDCLFDVFIDNLCI